MGSDAPASEPTSFTPSISGLEVPRRTVIACTETVDGGQGCDLGWAGPGQFVPEFEQTLNALAPGGLSEPIVSRFGVHLIQLLERRAVVLDARQQREAARNALREQKYDEAYAEWARDVRARAFVELRDPPQL